MARPLVDEPLVFKTATLLRDDIGAAWYELCDEMGVTASQYLRALIHFEVGDPSLIRGIDDMVENRKKRR